MTTGVASSCLLQEIQSAINKTVPVKKDLFDICGSQTNTLIVASAVQYFNGVGQQRSHCFQ